jgi:hypothetical protein
VATTATVHSFTGIPAVMGDSNLPRTSSSVPPELPTEQRELFRRVLTTLNACEIPYAVAGAFALQQHTGIWHPTKDLDLSLTGESVGSALHCLQNDGFTCEVVDPIWLAKAYRGDFFVDLISGMSNGVIAVNRAWIDRAHSGSVVGVPARVLAPEELLASKLFVTRRERFDGADIAHIIYALHGQLDWQRLLEILGEHWQLLLWALMFFAYVYPAEVSLVPSPLWQDLLERFDGTVKHPDPNLPFRGSLVDPHLFAIDVNEWGFEDQLSAYRAKREGVNPGRA